MTALTTNGIHPAIKDHYVGMNEALHERDKFHADSVNLQNKLIVEQGNNTFLQNQLDKITKERDYHMRLNFELTSRMNSIRGIMDSMFEVAAGVADSKPAIEDKSGWPKNEQD